MAMETERSDNLHRPDRYVVSKPSHERRETRPFTKPIVFRYANSSARKVAVVGTFNKWNPEANPMEQMVDGTWQIIIEVPRGHFEYHFLVDNAPVLDPERGTVSDGNGGKHNLISVT